MTQDDAYIVAIMLAYFVPTVIALFRSHRSRLAIIAVNILVGWTVIGYFWAFIWSLTGNVQKIDR